MNTKIKNITGGILLILLSACTTDFEVNAPYDDITIVYGILDRSADTQFIKINKAFQNRGGNANDIADNFDSLNYDSEQKVIIEVFSNGAKIKELEFQADTFNNKKDGVFANPENLLYFNASNYSYPLDANYRLKISRSTDDIEIKGSTNIVGPADLVYPVRNGRLNFGDVEKLIMRWQGDENGFFYNMTVNIPVWEYNLTTGDSNLVTIDWQIFNLYRANINASILNQFEVQSEEFFRLMNTRLEKNENIARRVDSAYVRLIGGNEELYTYIKVNEPPSGVVQKVPEYTNLENAIGVLASRHEMNFSVQLSDGTIDSLRTGRITDNLNFVGR